LLARALLKPRRVLKAYSRQYRHPHGGGSEIHRPLAFDFTEVIDRGRWIARESEMSVRHRVSVAPGREVGLATGGEELFRAEHTMARSTGAASANLSPVIVF
jgi:hypothetical protein